VDVETVVRHHEALRREDRATQGCDPSARRRPEAEASRWPARRRDASLNKLCCLQPDLSLSTPEKGSGETIPSYKDKGFPTF